MTVVLRQTFRPGGDQLLEVADPLQNAVQGGEDVLPLQQPAQVRLLARPFRIADAFAAAAFAARQLVVVRDVVGDVVVDAQPMVQSGERAADAARGATAPSPVTVKAPGPPVDRGVVDDGGRDGVFVREGGGEGPGFVSMRDLEDQILLEAVVVPEVLRTKKVTGQLQPCFSMLAKRRTHLLGPRQALAHRTAGALAVAPDPGDRTGRADGAAALRLAVAAAAADGVRRQGRVRRAAAARDPEAGDRSARGKIAPLSRRHLRQGL